ncbi:MAG: DUF1614 domain-containing protein [Candidatus Nealsonbacteria bacterium]
MPLLFILALPLLFLLGYFHIVTVGFEKLGIPSELTFLILFLILLGSLVNIPLGRKKVFIREKGAFFGLFKIRQPEVEGLAINLGGGVLPILLSIYFLTKIPWQPAVAATFLMVFIANYLARIVPGRGVSLPVLIPPIFSAIFAMLLIPDFAAPTAFVSGTLGVLIGADILNLRKIQRYGGFLSIGGAGVFDGIFLVGIVSALLAGF